MTAVRPAAVSGFFYPADPAELSSTVGRCLANARPTVGPVPKAIIAPHAGYVYSGDIAASAYARIRPAKDRISRVVLLGPCHRVAVRGLALSGADYFETPAGRIPIDKDAAAQIEGLGQVQVFDATHAKEHSLEVHLPFLQATLADFKLVPLVVGEATPADVAEVLDTLWGGPETLIVVSSDLSHYLDYDSARAIDGRTAKAIESLDAAAIERDGACGRFPVGGLLEMAKRKNLKVETVDLRNSGDTAGTKDKVVGYGSWLFTEPEKRRSKRIFGAKSRARHRAEQERAGNGAFEQATRALLTRLGPDLIRMAAASIKSGLETGKPLGPPAGLDPALGQNGAAFVTLKKAGQLRGCIGSPEAHRALGIDVCVNAFAAAFRDPRFPNLGADELTPELALSISVLSPQTPMSFRNEDDLLNQLRPGEDGLVIMDGAKRALFLPSVWDQLPDKRLFLQHLKKKAGMSPDHWSESFQANRFIAAEVSDADAGLADTLWD